MKVSLIDYTGAGTPDPADYAANILIFTKQTRLQMQPSLMETIKSWLHTKKADELKYMANTIPSSWEFVHYTFLIEGVTRAFTHQFVRSRQFSFAQQTMRVLNVKGWDYLAGPSVSNWEGLQGGNDPEPAGAGVRHALYKEAMEDISIAYDKLVAEGAQIEDARGVLPTNILTNIVGSCNMRTFVELVRKRSSSRTQGEYRDVLDEMKRVAIDVHPWLTLFIERDFEKAANDLDHMIKTVPEIPATMRTHMIKLIDQMRSQS